MRPSSAALAAFLACGCGARTGLWEPPAPTRDARASDASPVDVGTRDAGRDATAVDAVAAIDATLPDSPLDPPDPAVPCPDGLGSGAYLWGDDTVISRFDPATLVTSPLGPVSCEGRTDQWTLSVSRTGVAYVIYYEDSRVYAVDLATLVCTPTTFVPTQLGLQPPLAIAISRDPGAERLLVYGESVDAISGARRRVLAASDLDAFVLTPIAEIDTMPVLIPADMQADARGHLDLMTYDGLFLQVDVRNGAATRSFDTPFVSGAGGWAIMTYDDRVLFFGSPRGTVHEVDVARGTLTVIGEVGISVVGASAAACLHH